MNRKYTDEQIEFLKNNHKGLDSTKLTDAFNEYFKTQLGVNSITSIRYKLGLNSGLNRSIQKGEHRSPATEFKKGQISWNKGKKGIRMSVSTEFKLGQKPVNTQPIGTIIMRSDGYLWKKIAETVPARFGWRQVHRLNWENAYGPIPKSHKVIFLNGDRYNCELSNLMMITSAQMATINKHNLIKKDPELTKTGVVIADLISKSYRLKQSLRKIREVRA